VVELRGHHFSKLENRVLENYFLSVRNAVEKLQTSKVKVKQSMYRPGHTQSFIVS
jgi:hypothetical protein